MSGVIVDTCIWSLALRGKEPKNIAIAKQLTNLIHENRAKILGSIRQELLSGYSNLNQYKKLRDKMFWFPNEDVIDKDYETAAEFSNTCRKEGIQGSHIDFLICAVSVRLNIQIFTEDKDFSYYQKYIPIKLY
jgi:predicted nucleic acid-binding protein